MVFVKGDLALTCNSRAPLVNNGHLVTILEVLGPELDFGFAFAYVIERVDGQPFAVACKPGTPIPVAGGCRVLAEQQQLRPLRDRPEDFGVDEAEKVPAQA